MSDRARQLVAFIIAMGMVIAVASAPTLGQVAEEAIEIAAGLNADTVDGRHAVGSGASKAKRARKLVATNRKGYLPSNIVKPYWGAIKNKPAGFADGVDDIGPTYTSKILYDSTVSDGPIAASDTRRVAVAGMPRNADLHFSVVPREGNHTMRVENVDVWWANDGGHSYTVHVRNLSPWPANFKLRALIFAEGIAPAKLKRALATARVKVVEKG